MVSVRVWPFPADRLPSSSLAPEDSEVSSQCPSASGSSGSDSSYVSGQALGRGLEDLSCVSTILSCIYQPQPRPMATFPLGGNGSGWARGHTPEIPPGP